MPPVKLIGQLIAALFLPSQAGAESCAATSSIARTALLELYTSEGCNSCPPADSWVSTLRTKGMAPAHVVPLAFHVDYWDRLGWRDPFAQARFTTRQQEAANRHSAAFVYTPQLLLNGYEFRGTFHDEALRDAVSSPSNATVPVSIRISQEPARAHELKIRSTASWSTVPIATSQLFLVLFENSLQSDVTAGENDGRRLHHDYVVRTLAGPFDMTTANNSPIEQTLALNGKWISANMGIAAFVQRKDSGEILQAMSAPVCR